MTERDKKDGMGAKLIVPAVLLMFVAPQLAAFIILGLALTWSGKKKKEMRQNRGLSTLDGGSKKKPRRIPRDDEPARHGHSHVAAPAYNPDTGNYQNLKITACYCPRCGFATDTTHRFCSRCDQDMTKPHLPIGRLRSLFRKKEEDPSAWL